MGLRQMYTAETMFIDDGLTDGAMFPPSSNAVYDALQNATELPSVTADDNGDVLTVVEGAWAKATPSGGSVDFADLIAMIELSNDIEAGGYGEELTWEFWEYDSETQIYSAVGIMSCDAILLQGFDTQEPSLDIVKIRLNSNPASVAIGLVNRGSETVEASTADDIRIYFSAVNAVIVPLEDEEDGE